MEDIYLIPKKLKPMNINTRHIYLDEIYDAYPKNLNKYLEDILIREYDDNSERYDVIHIGEVVEHLKNHHPNIKINFLKADDIIIYFDDGKKDKTKYLRILIVCVIVFMGSIMGIMNFHADVNMGGSQMKMVKVLTGDAEKYISYFQIPYSLGIGIGVALFFNKFIPNYAKDEPSPLDLRITSLNKEIENQLISKRK